MLLKKLENTTLYPRDVVTINSNIMTTREGTKYKILTTKPKKDDWYYDTIMNRIEQLDSKDWDTDVTTYRKAILNPIIVDKK